MLEQCMIDASRYFSKHDHYLCAGCLEDKVDTILCPLGCGCSWCNSCLAKQSNICVCDVDYTKLEPRELFPLLSKIKDRLDDHFWAQYFIKYVDLKYLVEPELMIRGKWKDAFCHNYAYLEEWNQTSKYRAWCGIDDNGYMGYWNISTDSKQVILVPALHPESLIYSGTAWGGIEEDKIEFDLQKEGKTILDAVYLKKPVLVYPYHHTISFTLKDSKQKTYRFSESSEFNFENGELGSSNKIISITEEFLTKVHLANTVNERFRDGDYSCWILSTHTKGGWCLTIQFYVKGKLSFGKATSYTLERYAKWYRDTYPTLKHQLSTELPKLYAEYDAIL